MVSIQYISATSKQASPEGRDSFPFHDFPRRFSAWYPDWLKQVRMSDTILDYRTLPLADLVYQAGAPDAERFENKPTVLLFEDAEAFVLVRADFFTRLLFSEQNFISRSIKVGSLGVMTVESALATRRAPTDEFWTKVGLPGVPLAIGVNASVRSSDNNCELLAHKGAIAQGGMAGTVGPPVSAGATLDPDRIDFNNLTLGKLIDRAMESAADRELPNTPPLVFMRRAAWLDSGRGHKPEVNYRSSVITDDLARYAQAISQTHAGCVLIRGHLNAEGMLKPSAIDALAKWGLNFQAWCLWQ